jgi:hypothetical protein
MVLQVRLVVTVTRERLVTGQVRKAQPLGGGADNVLFLELELEAGCMGAFSLHAVRL